MRERYRDFRIFAQLLGGTRLGYLFAVSARIFNP